MTADKSTSAFIVAATLAAGPPTGDELRQLQRVARKIAGLKAERNRLILEAHAEGASLREIGAALGVNHVTVKNIIERTR
jgi:DNA-directed RNA polymerase specialized sigma24 family protein